MLKKKLSNSEQALWKAASSHLKKLYGDNPSAKIMERFDCEWKIISRNGYAFIFEAARQIALDSKKNGYRIEVISTLGSSFIAFLAGITESNPLPPHYHCRGCKGVVFPEGYSSPFGTDLHDKHCPLCGEKMLKDGCDIRPEMIWDLHGDKPPHVVFRITEGNLKNAIDAVSKFFYEEKIIYGDDSTVLQRIKNTALSGSSSYQPGSVTDSSFISMEPAMLRKMRGLFCLHFFPYSIDEVGSVRMDPWQHLSPHSIEALYFNTIDTGSLAELEMAESTSKSCPETIDLNDRKAFSFVPDVILERFSGNTSKARSVLSCINPGKFSDLVLAEGLLNSVGLWEDNEEVLLSEGVLYRDNMVACREDIISDLTNIGIAFDTAYRIVEAARKGRFGTHRHNAYWTDLLSEHCLSRHYVEMLEKVIGIGSRSAAIHMALTDYRLALYKAHTVHVEVE